MSERENQPELDDELLSAYLDDELSVEERAAVEARLANDPDAQHLLHQLRAVSQSVQMLPLEPVGRDLRAEILRRAEAHQSGGGGESDSKSAGVGDISPRVTIFGSRRSWIWASLAVAAGLMIMVLERGDEKGRALPAVAQNGQQGANRSLKEQKSDGPQMANEPAPVAENDAAKIARGETAPSLSEVGGSLRPDAAKPQAGVDKLAANDRAAGAPSGAIAGGGNERTRRLAVDLPADEVRRHDSPLSVGGGSRQPGSVTFDANTKSPPGASKISESSAASGVEPSATGQSFAAEGPLLVVHVVAKPGAFRGGSFEKMLANNRIAIEREEQPERAVASDVDKKSSEQLADAFDRSADKNDVDMVLVEAPKDVVTSCLANLQQDESNYVSVQVDQPTESEAGARAKDDLAKTLGDDLTRYNRGVVAEKQKSLTGDRFHAESAENNKKRLGAENESELKSVATDDHPTPNEKEELHRPIAGIETRGRALRLPSSYDEKKSANEAKPRGGGPGGFGGGESSTLRRAVVDRKTSASGNADDVRVLFVVREEIPTASINPAKKAAE
jgi:hypothetical protein